MKNHPSRSWASATTLGDLLDMRACEQPHDEALVFPENRLTYLQLAQRADWFAQRFLGFGVDRGDRVGLLLPECCDTVAALFGALKIGAVPVPVSGRFKEFELSHVLGHSGIKILLTAAPEGDGTDFPALLEQTFADLPSADDESHLALSCAPGLQSVVLLAGEPRLGFLSADRFAAMGSGVEAETLRERAEQVRIRDTALIVYTSSETPTPRGAMLSHEAFCRFAAGTVEHRFHLSAQDRIWTPLPMFHVGGLAFVVMSILAGSTLIHPGFFHPEVALDQLEGERCTVALPAFETIWRPVAGHPQFGSRDLARLRIVLVTGGPERLRELQELVPQAVQVSSFGSTEACSFLAVGSVRDDLESRMTTGGRPLPGMECRVVNPANGEDLPPETEGELIYRGPNCFDGYFRDPELTARVIDADGWFHSGDLGTMDRLGRITFRGRIKAMLKVGGENVSTAEVEAFLRRHPAVKAVQVVGAPDAYYSEVPAAFVQLRAGTAATEQELIDFCLGRMATFRVPRYIRFVDEWPLVPTGNMKQFLTEQVARELRQQGITEAPRLETRAAAAGGA